MAVAPTAPWNEAKGVEMSYFVTSGADAQYGPAAIDQPAGARSFELADALAHACRLIDENVANVAITDGGQRSISGDELVACCKGGKEITPDLQVVAISA
jgi:hypothetical protein